MNEEIFGAIIKTIWQYYQL